MTNRTVIHHSRWDTKLALVAAYYRTSSVTNEDGHSRQRQQDAVAEYAQRMGYQIEVTRWDIHTGDSTVIDRPGFSELLGEVQSRDISIILIENASRFARDLLHQEAGVQALSKLNIQIIPVDAPETFTEDNPSRVLIRQVLGAVSEFEKASLVSKLKAQTDADFAKFENSQLRQPINGLVSKNKGSITSPITFHQQQFPRGPIWARMGRPGSLRICAVLYFC